MRKVLVIGIGAGDPDYMTIQAIKALNAADVIFVIDKGQEKDGLARFRKEICERYIEEPTHRFVEMADPPRDRAGPGYEAAVDAWRRKRIELYKSAIGRELKDDECGAFLVWGDPSLYDGTIQLLQQILSEQPALFEYEVIPGISSIQALAARHKVPLNRTGEAIQITTGRRLSAGFPSDVDNLVVMLDSDAAFRSLSGQDVDVYWGAYLGMSDEILLAGKLRDVMDEIERVRKAKRAMHGWIMDTYLLRRSRPD